MEKSHVSIYFYTHLSIKLYNEKRTQNWTALSYNCKSVNVAQQFLLTIPAPSSCQASQYSPLVLRQQNEALNLDKAEKFLYRKLQMGKTKSYGKARLFRITRENNCKKLMSSLFLIVAVFIRTKRLRARRFYCCIQFYVAYKGVYREPFGEGTNPLPEFSL